MKRITGSSSFTFAHVKALHAKPAGFRERRQSTWIFWSPFSSQAPKQPVCHCHRDFKARLFVRVNSSNVYFRTISSHFWLSFRSYLHHERPLFSALLRASKLLMAYCIPLWEQGPHPRIGLGKSCTKHVCHFVLEAGKHDSAMQEKQALQGILRITWYTT